MSDQKTEEPSGKRLAEARSKGQIARSQDITATILLGAGLFFLMGLGGWLANALATGMRNAFGHAGLGANLEGLHSEIASAVPKELVGTLFIFFAALFVCVLAVQIAQVGFEISSEKMFEDPIAKFNPINGFKGLFSLSKLFASMTGTAKLIIVGFCAWWGIKALMRSDVFVRPVAPSELGRFLIEAAWAIGWRILMVLASISAIDYAYQKWKVHKDLMMTKDEIKEEARSGDTPPELKARLQSRRLEIFRRSLSRHSLRRMMEKMSDATIVVTNPTHYSVALRYVKGETPVPVVLAKGKQRVAKLIREKAVSLHVPMRPNPPLAQGLFKHAEIGQPIPELYFRGVALLLAELIRTGLLEKDGRIKGFGMEDAESNLDEPTEDQAPPGGV